MIKPYFENEWGKLYLGDCLEVMNWLKTHIPLVDMVLCDPPYGTTRNKWDSIIPLNQMWHCVWSVAKNNSAVVMTAQTPFDKVLGCSCIEKLRYEWVWEKTSATGHLNANRQPMKSHENILVFYTKLPTYNPNKTEGHQRKVSTAYHKRGCSKSSNWGEFNPSSYDSTERFPRSVLKLPSDKQKSALHPTQKPVALFAYLISTYTNMGETVLDFCAGSGTTAIAAESIGRRWICIEREEGYCEIIAKRLTANRN